MAERRRSGALWVAPMLEYEIRRMTRGGVKDLVLTRSPTWFAERSKAWLGDRNTPPPPRVFGVRESSDGLLWAFVQVASDQWRDAWTRVPSGMREAPINQVDFDKFFDVVVEAIDPTAGRVVARRRLKAAAVAEFHKVQCCTACHENCGFGLNEAEQKKAYLAAKNAADQHDVAGL